MVSENLEAQKNIVPPIKCQGIKTGLVDWIKTKLTPYHTWYEPFCGTCAVGFSIRPPKAVFADINPYVINFYQDIQAKHITHKTVRSFLEHEGNQLLQSNGAYYYEVRNRFNRLHRSLDFLFLNRACFNGLIRFNAKGAFNTPFCKKPNRFSKSYITKICNQVQKVAEIICHHDYKFIHQDFTKTIPTAHENDLIYCDPPYIGRHTDYFTSWNIEHEKALYQCIQNTKAKFILSTWHSNRFRENEGIKNIWSAFTMDTKEHFYFVGGKANHRHAMKEALIYKTR